MKKIFRYRDGLITSLLLAIFYSNVYALQGSTAENGSNAQAVHSLGITGKGVHVGAVTSGSVLTTHLAFQDSNGISHAINHDVLGIGFSYTYHDTPFAGIIISRGSLPSHQNDIGVAPDAFVHCAKIVDSDNSIQLVLAYLIKNQSCRIIVSGIHWPSHVANGQSQRTLMYDYYAEMNDVIFANAAGNDSNHITVYGDCYNGITTGGLEDPIANNYSRVGDITCPGPTVDGRRKPEVMAPSTYQVAPGYNSGSNNYWNTGYGDGATSWAVPHTAGVAALLLEYANQTISEPDDGHSEVIKAVIVNSTFPNIKDKAGNPTNPASPENVWHSERGYGRIDALRAFQTLSAGRITRNGTITAAAGWAYDTLASNATHVYYLKGEKNERLILTVTWNRLVTRNGSPTTYYDEASPKFNINVTVKNQASEVIFYENDMLDNLEKVDLILPADGIYTVSLKNPTSKSRNYGLAFGRLEPLTGDFNIDYVVNREDLSLIALDWLTAGDGTDIIADGIVNWLDFTKFADNWLKIDSRYYNP